MNFVFASLMALQVLQVTVIPDEDPRELIRKFEPLGQHLERATGMEVRYVPVTNYAAAVDALVTGRVDLAWLGGLTHVQARLRGPGVRAIIMRAEDTDFHSKFIVGADSGIEDLGDLKGRTFTFGSVSSTSGHLMPRYFLEENGLNPERDFDRFAFSNAHDVTALWVEAGRVDAGVLNEAVWETLVRDGRVDSEKVRVIWTTPSYPDYNWTVRAGLDPELIRRIQGAFLELDEANPDHRVILDLQRTRGYVEADNSVFAPIEEAARRAGLIQR